jgi:hypothetical protein
MIFVWEKTSNDQIYYFNNIIIVILYTRPYIEILIKRKLEQNKEVGYCIFFPLISFNLLNMILFCLTKFEHACQTCEI